MFDNIIVVLPDGSTLSTNHPSNFTITQQNGAIDIYRADKDNIYHHVLRINVLDDCPDNVDN